MEGPAGLSLLGNGLGERPLAMETSNGAIASGVGIGLAWFATVVVNQIREHGLLAGLAEALKIPGRVISAVFVAMLIAPFQALKRWIRLEVRAKLRLGCRSLNKLRLHVRETL